jgi:hypothetical protein
MSRFRRLARDYERFPEVQSGIAIVVEWSECWSIGGMEVDFEPAEHGLGSPERRPSTWRAKRGRPIVARKGRVSAPLYCRAELRMAGHLGRLLVR